jgi:hypothetical protein
VINRRRRTLGLLALLTLTAAILSGIPLFALHRAHLRWVIEHQVCAEVPTTAHPTGIRPSENINDRGYPYGEVTSCRVLRRTGHWVGSVDASAWLLLTTTVGLVALRADYRDTNAGRQYTTTAVELAPGHVPDLSADEGRRHREDVRTRGGTRTRPWILSYGDG